MRVVIFAVLIAASSAFMIGNYFPNWAQYRSGEFSYKPQDMEAAIDKFNYVVYAFAWMEGGCTGCSGPSLYNQIGQCKFSNGSCSYFESGDATNPQCPAGSTRCSDSSYQLVYPEPADEQFIQDIVNFKNQHPDLKVLLSIGGWNFPSAVWSEMVSTSQGRSSFITSVKANLEKYNFDGVDLDWEYWCSAPRRDHIKITNETFENYFDVGGKCPDDGKNLYFLVKELRQALGSEKIITLATQADLDKMKHIDMRGVTAEIDYWHLMAYDYSVSDLPEMCGDAPCFANFTAPNQPLYSVKQGEIPSKFKSSVWSVNYTIKGYKELGVPGNKMLLGLAFYGHHWYIPNQHNSWQRFGTSAQISGKCFGPFAQTYGAWAGRRARLCGLLIYSEIVSLIDPNNSTENWFDPVSRSDVGYIRDGSKTGENLQGATPSAVAWNSIRSLKEITQYAMDEDLAGVFAFDSSMDVFDDGYPVVSAIYETVHGGPSKKNNCDPQSCNVCNACCKSYLHNQQDCDDCVKQEC